METTIAAVTARLRALDLRVGTIDAAHGLATIRRELVEELGETDAGRCFDAALRAAVVGHPAGTRRLAS